METEEEGGIAPNRDSPTQYFDGRQRGCCIFSPWRAPKDVERMTYSTGYLLTADDFSDDEGSFFFVRFLKPDDVLGPKLFFYTHQSTVRFLQFQL